MCNVGLGSNSAVSRSVLGVIYALEEGIFCLLFPFLARFKRSGLGQIWRHRESNNSSLSLTFARKSVDIQQLKPTICDIQNVKKIVIYIQFFCHLQRSND